MSSLVCLDGLREGVRYPSKSTDLISMNEGIMGVSIFFLFLINAAWFDKYRSAPFCASRPLKFLPAVHESPWNFWNENWHSPRSNATLEVKHESKEWGPIRSLARVLNGSLDSPSIFHFNTTDSTAWTRSLKLRWISWRIVWSDVSFDPVVTCFLLLLEEAYHFTGRGRKKMAPTR